MTKPTILSYAFPFSQSPNNINQKKKKKKDVILINYVLSLDNDLPSNPPNYNWTPHLTFAI